jgi:regulator of sigma E protease
MINMDFLIETLLQGWHLILFYLLPFIIVIGIMIFFHELGHFLLAKAFGVKVLKFALGYGPPFLAKQVGETEYSIRYFPLGGFVKMLGEDIEDEESDETPSPEDIGRSFTDVHVIKRISIVAAGPVFNIVLAFFLFFGMFLISGTQVMTPIIGEVQADSPAQQVGLQKGDRIISIQNNTINSWDEIRGYVSGHAGETLLFHVQRAEKILSFNIIPRESTAKNEFGEETKTALIGIVASGDIEQIKLSLPEAAVKGISDTLKWIKLTFLVVIKLFQGVVPIKTIGGPIMIGQMTGQLAQENVGYLVPFMAIISVNLGILNLFPIPILDGGVIVFLIIELIIRRPLSLKKRELAQKVGLSLLILLMAFVFYNDILRLFQSG